MDESNPLRPGLLKGLIKPLQYINSRLTLTGSSRNDLSAAPRSRLSLGKRARAQQAAAAADDIDSITDDQIHQQEAAAVEFYTQDPDLEDEEEEEKQRQRRRQADRGFAADDAWLARQEELRRAYLQQLPQQQQLDQQLADFQAGIYRATIEQHGAAGCCACGHDRLQQVHQVPVLVVDVTSRMQLQVPVLRCCNPACSCTTAVQPLQLSCWPSNPKRAYDLTTAAAASGQQVWFTMRLMAHADATQMIVRRVPMYRYCQTLEHTSRAAGFGPAVPRLDILLGPALLQYKYVICFLANLANLGAAPQAGPLALCAACWKQAQGPQGIHSIHVDFCFKLTHLAKATKTWGTREPPNSRFFLPGEEVRTFQQTPGSMERVEEEKDCSDFKAAEAVARRSGKNDVTAVGAVTCRHGVPIKMMDIETGERYCYATMLLLHVLLVCNTLVRFVWYDINCKYAVHFTAWVERLVGPAKDALRAALQRITPLFPLPVFHQYAHSAKCQRQYGALAMKGAGLAHGEPIESCWAMLGEFGWSTQYMHLHNRRGRLERAALWYAEGIAARLPITLHDMLHRALDKRGAAIAGVRGAVEELRLDRAAGEPEFTEEQVQLQLRQYEQSLKEGTAGAHGSIPKPWKVEWVELKLKLYYIDKDSEQELPGISAAFADSTFSAAEARADSLRKRVRCLERKHPEEAFPEVGTPEFNSPLVEYLEYEVQRMQSTLRMSSIDYVCLNRLYNKLAGRPKVQRSVRASMQRLEKGMQAGLSNLQNLLQRGMQRLPQQLQMSMSEHADWSMDALKQGRLFVVGHAVGNAGCPQGAGRLLLLERLRVHALEYDRACEEVQLVVQEMKDSLDLYQLQLQAISVRFEELAPGENLDTSMGAADSGAMQPHQLDNSWGTPPLEAAADGDVTGQQPMHMVACTPLQYSTYERGAAVYLKRQWRQVYQQQQRASSLFQEVLTRREQLVRRCGTAAAVPSGDGIEEQLGAAVDLQEAEQLLQQGAGVAVAQVWCDGLDGSPQDGMEGQL